MITNTACYKRGKAFEYVLQDLFKNHGYGLKPSTKEQDIKDHADFYAYSKSWQKWLSVDAKAMKRINRSGNLQDKFAYVEWKNVLGDDGWLVKGADVIAFERQHNVILISRQALLRFCLERINMRLAVDEASESLYCVYSRQNRDDLISMICLDDLPSDQLQVWDK